MCISEETTAYLSRKIIQYRFHIDKKCCLKSIKHNFKKQHLMEDWKNHVAINRLIGLMAVARQEWIEIKNRTWVKLHSQVGVSLSYITSVYNLRILKYNIQQRLNKNWNIRIDPLGSYNIYVTITISPSHRYKNIKHSLNTCYQLPTSSKGISLLSWTDGKPITVCSLWLSIINTVWLNHSETN